MKNDLPALNKGQLIDTLHAWINQRPGLDPANYDRDLTAYRSDARHITRDLHDARALLRYVELRDSITADDIIKATRHSFSGRLTINQEDGKFSIDYCTGQYWPTEYRRAVAVVLSSAIWEWLRKNRTDANAEDIRTAARRELGRTLATRFFN